MNILFFLTPKNDVAYLYNDYTLRQALEKMNFRKYSAIPIINRKGEYKGTITEGDILWYIYNQSSWDFKDAEKVLIQKIEKRLHVEPVAVNANIEDLIMKSMNQNFIPVIDDENIFIGIVTRKDIIQYCYGQVIEMEQQKG